jgi:HAD superfamily hydrolase (TIGR01484 family)
MIPLARASRDELSRIRALLFDLDDTLLTHGRLTRGAFDVLNDLADAKLSLIAVTGRPAGWGEVLARQWPVLGVVSENGAVLSWREGDAIRRSLRHGDDAHAPPDAPPDAPKNRVMPIVDALRREIPGLVLADDNAARITDVTLDVGEREKVAPEVVERARAFFHARGLRTILSSVHLHATFEGDDKASGAMRMLRERLGWDAGVSRARAAFVGDSENDSACFCAFSTTVGVANVARWVPRLSVPPRFVTVASMGEGFAELARALVSARKT